LGVKTLFAKASKIGSNEGDIRLLGAFTSTFFLTLTNPMTILSFAAIFAGIGLGGPQCGFTPAILMVNGVFFGSIVWWTVLSGSVAAIQSRLNPVRLLYINGISGLIIASFGLWILAGLIRR
jgi:threonine/homoserine/homoserine lactone efflux protein